MKNVFFFTTILFTTIMFIFMGCAKQGDSSAPTHEHEERIKLLIAESGKNLTYRLLTKDEVEQLTSANNYQEAATRSSGGNGNSGLVIVCYDCEGSSESCFGIHGAGDCADINCDEGCCCFEVS